MINIQISEEKFRQILREVYEMGRQDEQASSDYFLGYSKGYSKGYSEGYSKGYSEGYDSCPHRLIDITPYYIDTTPYVTCNTNQLTTTNTMLTVSCDGTCEVTTTDAYNSLDSVKIRG